MKLRLSQILIVFVLPIEMGCLEPPATIFNLSNATTQHLLVSSRDAHTPEFRELWEIAPGQSRALYVYRTHKKANLALEQGLELKLKTNDCSSSISNSDLREKTKAEGQGRWVFVVQPEMITCR